ncbi:MAG: tetratricopeptide repeat protein [Alphaproteobacteria bacterium]
MRRLRRILLALLVALAAATSARASGGPSDALFERLAAAGDPAQARRVEGEIWAAWAEQGGPAAASLMQLGTAAMAAGNLPAALGLFDAITRQHPSYAEGWNKRATVFYMLGALDNAAEDCAKVLALEPRHFGALSGLGMIRARQDRVDEAVEAFAKALAIHPHLEGARQKLDELRRKQRDGAI